MSFIIVKNTILKKTIVKTSHCTFDRNNLLRQVYTSPDIFPDGKTFNTTEKALVYIKKYELNYANNMGDDGEVQKDGNKVPKLCKNGGPLIVDTGPNVKLKLSSILNTQISIKIPAKFNPIFNEINIFDSFLRADTLRKLNENTYEYISYHPIFSNVFYTIESTEINYSDQRIADLETELSDLHKIIKRLEKDNHRLYADNQDLLETIRDIRNYK